MTKEDKIWRREFIAFLKKNGIYEKWIYNMKHQHPLTNYAWWNCFARIYENKSYNGINCVFYWADTKEGHEFWRFYDRLWKYNCGVIRTL